MDSATRVVESVFVAAATTFTTRGPCGMVMSFRRGAKPGAGL
jgi:hypothetical protein